MKRKEMYDSPEICVMQTGAASVICMSCNSFDCPDWLKGTENWFEDEEE